MRFIYGLILLVFVAVLVFFGWQNRELVPINYCDQTLTAQNINRPMYEVIGAAYVLGMLSGWTVVGFLRRSVERVTERRDDT